MVLNVLRDIARKWTLFENKTTEKFTPFQVRLWNALVFLSRFAVLALPFHLILWTNFDAFFLQTIVAKSVFYLLSFSGVFVTQADNFLYVQVPFLWTVEIIKDCVGWKSFLAFSGLVFAVRAVRLKTRVLGLIVGAHVIFLGNIIRIYTSIYASLVYGTETFPFIHDVLWQWGLMMIVLVAWLCWMRYFRVGIYAVVPSDAR